MALQGSLDTFSLPDVLRLLATTSKTGRLRIDGDRGRGSVWLRDGGVIDAHADRTLDGTPRDEVIFELMRFGSGTFDFDGDDTGSSGGEADDVESLLTRADGLLSEWSELEAIVPSLEHEVTLAGDLSTDEVTIGADSWRSLVAVSSGRTVGELASALDLTELGVSRAVRDLVDLGVVEVSRAPAPRLAASRRPSAASRPTAAPAADERPRQPATAGPDSMGAPVIPSPGQPQRAGWISERTGEVPAMPAPADPSAPRARRRDADARADDTPAPEVPDPPAPAPEPAKGGLASRLGRNRNGGSSARNGAAPARPEPSVNGSHAPAPSETPTARGDDAGRGGSDVGPRSRRRSGEPTPPAAPAAPASFDDDRLGPAPAPPMRHDTGQTRPASPPPSDLPWADDDVLDTTSSSGPPTSPFAGLSNLPSGPPPPSPLPSQPPLGDGDVAPHVAAMSTEAQAAVQRTVGPSGGSQNGPAAGRGEDAGQRGRLISFLSSIR